MAVLGAVAWWAIPLTHAVGGRTPGAVPEALLAIVPALVLTRPWSRLPRWVLALGLAVAAGAIAVCGFAPTGWTGADTAAAYVYAVVAFWVAMAYARTPTRQRLLAVAVALAGLDQFGHAFEPFWDGGQPGRTMVGTFYWHNQYAAFLLAPALAGLALVVGDDRRLRPVGWAVAPLSVAGIVLSTSRAALACAVVGWLVVGLVVAARSGRLRRLARWGVAGGLCALAVIALTGPPLFLHRVSPFGALQARAAAGQSLATNGGYRVDFWVEAWRVFAHHPVAGGGYGSLPVAATGLVPSSWARSTYAHNGLLQAVSDGGLLLGVPFLLACLAIGTALLRRAWTAFRRDGDVVLVGLVLGALALLAHSAVDFDWSYPALFTMTALVAGAALGGARHRRTMPDRGRSGGFRALALLAITAIVATPLLAAASTSWSDGTTTALERASHESPATAVAAVERASRRPLGGYRPWATLLEFALPATPGGPLRLPRQVVLQALVGTSAAAQVDRRLAVERVRALALLGEPVAARKALDVALASLHGDLGPVADLVGLAYADLGDRAAARRILVTDLIQSVAAQSLAASSDVAALLAIDANALDEVDRCAWALASPGAHGTLDGLSAPAAPADPASCPAELAAAS
ncbi:MAG TPA: O-antigen ligase family protein [Mycobacteriales bacterium]|nr:O-antigen ligase family protein [Mycobacteriales bacterium]